MTTTADTEKKRSHVAAFQREAHDYAKKRGVAIESERNHAGCAVRVGRSAVLFDTRFESVEEYRCNVLADVVALIDAKAEIDSDEMHAAARKRYTAIALVPVGERPGLYQVASLVINDGQVVSVKRHRKHEPEMGHFALHVAYEALRDTYDPHLADHEDAAIELTPETAALLQAPEQTQASKVKL